MSEEVAARVFDPFFTTAPPDAQRLGLAVIQGIVADYRGTIEVKSAPGSGTTFTIELPLGK
jgi:signal transduction histidine kinase